MATVLSAGLDALGRVLLRLVFGRSPGNPACRDCGGRGAHAVDAGHADVLDVRPCHCLRRRR